MTASIEQEYSWKVYITYDGVQEIVSRLAGRANARRISRRISDPLKRFSLRMQGDNAPRSQRAADRRIPVHTIGVDKPYVRSGLIASKRQTLTKELKGVMALLPTPLTEEGRVDEPDLRSEIDFAIENGCDSAGVLAGIGEGYLLSHENWTAVAKIAVDHASSRFPMLLGCATMGTGQAVELVREAENLGADAILAFKPQGMGPYKDEGIYQHFKAMTEATDIQIVPYAREADPVPFDVMKRLVDEERVRYMKYGQLRSFGDCEMLQKLDKSLGDKLFKFCGADSWTLRYLLLGCKGIMTATAAVFPKENVELLSLVQKGKIWEARKYYYEKFLVWNDSAFYENWQSAHKLALKLMGVIKSAAQPIPQSPMADYQIKEIEALLKYLGKITGSFPS